ncbi:glycerophosphodiester phosphodiesterase family protein [Acuticoccus yangtzensis]|uniref:glycerophosphodiester phosphodiesterase family protein n=1 Tax=Acuticoccus yangtzensis TaxID=1443441 RepID=UPI0009494F55|nr:glycerophosphodiester phosphodiesterase family protein [Acuticoccus yangtzensis]
MTAIIGHRGARNLWAENSATGFRNAVALACDAIEFDVHLTDAGEVVVIHDATLDRTTDAAGPVAALTPDARRAVRLTDSEDGLPALGDVLDILAPAEGLGLHVELKLGVDGRPYEGLAAKVAEAVTARGLGPRCHLTSFSVDVLEACRDAAPGIRRLVSADEAWITRQGGLAAFIGRVHGLADVMALRHDFLEPEWDAVAASWDVERVCVWTVNDEATMREFLARGVGNMTTDRPDLALTCRDGAFGESRYRDYA